MVKAFCFAEKQLQFTLHVPENIRLNSQSHLKSEWNWPNRGCSQHTERNMNQLFLEVEVIFSES